MDQVLFSYQIARCLVHARRNLLLLLLVCSWQDWIVLTDYRARLKDIGELRVISNPPYCICRNCQGSLDPLYPDNNARRLLVQLR